MDYATFLTTSSRGGPTVATLVRLAFDDAVAQGRGNFDSAVSAASVACAAANEMLPGDNKQALDLSRDVAADLLQSIPGYTPVYGSIQADAQQARQVCFNRRDVNRGLMNRIVRKATAQVERIAADIQGAANKRARVAQEAAADAQHALAGVLQAQIEQDAKGARVQAQNRVNAANALAQYPGGAQDGKASFYLLQCCCIACEEGKVWSVSRYLTALIQHMSEDSSDLSGNRFPIPLGALPPANMNVSLSGFQGRGGLSAAMHGGSFVPTMSGLAGAGEDFWNTFVDAGKTQLQESVKDAGKDTITWATKKAKEALATGLAKAKIETSKKTGVPPEKVTDKMVQQEMQKDPGVAAIMQMQMEMLKQQIAAQAPKVQAASGPSALTIGLIVGGVALVAALLVGGVALSRRPKAA